MLLPIVAVSDFDNDGTSHAISPLGFVKLNARVPSVVALRDRLRFARFYRFPAATILRRYSLLGVAFHRIRNARSERIVVPRRGVVSLRIVRTRIAASPQNRLRLPQARGRLINVSVVLVFVVVLHRRAVDHGVGLVLVQRFEQFRRPILQTFHEHSFIITGVFTGAVSYKTVRVYTVFVEVFLASTKAGNQSRTFEADGVLVQSVQMGVAGVHPRSPVVVRVNVQTLASRQIRLVSPRRFSRPQLRSQSPRDRVDDGHVDGAVRLVVLLEPRRRLVVTRQVPGKGLRVAFVGRRAVQQTTC